MKPANHTKKIIFLAFLLSLLFHFGSIIYVTINNNDPITLSSEIPIQNKLPSSFAKASEDKQNEWVETKARAGNFGTPVFFQDDIEEEVMTKEQLEDKEIIPQKESQQKEEIVESVITEKKIEALPQSSFAEATADRPTSLLTEHVTQPLPQKKAPQQKQPLQSSRQFAAPKPPITLSQLTQGFLNHAKNEGSHAIHMLGKKSGTPSDEQMKYERYLQKLSWCLQNSFNIHNDRFPTSATKDDTVQVLLSLNQDGSLKHCHISKTSGNRELDYFTIFIFNDASTSFPPVPHYLPHNPFTINYIIMVSASEENRWKLYRQ